MYMCVLCERHRLAATLAAAFRFAIRMKACRSRFTHACTTIGKRIVQRLLVARGRVAKLRPGGGSLPMLAYPATEVMEYACGRVIYDLWRAIRICNRCVQYTLRPDGCGQRLQSIAASPAACLWQGHGSASPTMFTFVKYQIYILNWIIITFYVWLACNLVRVCAFVLHCQSIRKLALIVMNVMRDSWELCLRNVVCVGVWECKLHVCSGCAGGLKQRMPRKRK